MSPFLGEIKMFAGSFAPRGYAFCSGQLMSIAQNNALFAILGTTYGGDGQATFALPELRGRFPTHAGSGPGLSNHVLGQRAGTETVTLTTSNLPAHTHPVVPLGAPGSTAIGDTNSPTNAVLAASPTRGEKQYTSTAANTSLAAAATSNTGTTGSGIPVSVLPPYLAVNFIIALEGIFPSRN